MPRLAATARLIAGLVLTLIPEGWGQALTDAQIEEMADQLGRVKRFPGGVDALNELTSELTTCSAITLAASICIGNSPGENALAKKIRDVSD